MLKINLKSEQGVVATITLLGISAVVLAIVSSLTLIALEEFKMAQTGGGALEQTFYAAEAGLNEALYRLVANPALAGETFEWEGYTIDLEVAPDPEYPYQRILTATAVSPDHKIRKVGLTANTSSFAAGFDYAVQGGQGGIFLDNNSLIVGGVYANGNIGPASGGARGEIQGDVRVAENYEIRKTEVQGNVYAHQITDSSISDEAYYEIIDEDTEVAGSPCPNSSCHLSVMNLDPEPFPIDDSDVDDWKTQIEETGTVLEPNPENCPERFSEGFYCLEADGALGNQKIEGNFYLGNGARLTLTGNLWVTGDLILDNNGSIKIDSSLGPFSVTVFSDGIVDINNNYLIEGSGNPQSFLLMLSTNTSTNYTAPAIYAANNSESIVFAALNGMLKVKNNGQINAAVAEMLYLEPKSKVYYSPLMSFFVTPSSGGGNEVGTALGSWQEF